MRTTLTVLGAALCLIALLGLGVGLNWFGLWADRPMQSYAKETERQVYQNSVARQQGANNSIAQDCANLEGATGPDAKAFARFVLTDAAAYSGDQGLSSASQHCISEAHSALAQ